MTRLVLMSIVFTGALLLESLGEQTRVTWSDQSDFGPNPFGHWMGLIVPHLVGKRFDQGLSTLKARAEAR